MNKNEMMNEVRALLGLGEGDRLEEVGVDGEEQHVGWGEATSPYVADDGQLDLDLVMMRLDQGHFDRLPKADTTPDVGCLWQAPDDPGLIYWEAAETAALLRGAPTTLRDDDLLFDLRQEAELPLVHVIHHGAEYVVLVSADGVAWQQVVRGISEELASELEVLKEPLPEFDVPTIDDLLAGRTCQKWLRSHVEHQLSSPSILSRAAGPGTLARLWTPESRGEAAAVLQEILSGTPPGLPCDEVQRWARSLTGDHLGLIHRLAVAETDALRGVLGAVHDAVVRDVPEMEQLVRNLVRRRDALASVAYALGLAGHSEAITSAIRSLDEIVVDNIVTISLVANPGDQELLAVVAWREPDAWWGRLSTQPTTTS